MASQDGILQWANTIRFNMANDPGRKYFNDQIQSHGFDFLRSYLDDIVNGGRQDQVIELLKTPGRNRSPKKQKVPNSASKLRHNVINSFQNDTNQLMENEPTNNLHRSLLQVQVKANKPTTPRTSPGPETRIPLSPKKSNLELSLECSITGSRQPEASLRSTSYSEDTLLAPLVDAPACRTEQPDLFVIEEDDESAERSRTSISPSAGTEEITGIMGQGGDTEHALMSIDDSVLGDGITDDHFEVEDDIIMIEETQRLDLHLPASSLQDELPVSNQQVPEPPQPVQRSSRHVSEDIPNADGPTAMDAALRSRADALIPLNDDDDGDSNGLRHKPGSTLTYQPMRKSVRVVRDPSTAPVTPGAALGGKRTSWLTKLREAKALEVPRPTAPVESVVPSSTKPKEIGYGKRKSGEMLAETKAPAVLASDGLDNDHDHDHIDKKPKHHNDRTTEKNPRSQTAQILEFENSPAADHEDGVLQFLKKTVEGMGVRANKSSGKSLGGSATVNAFAEAKAAAQARVAEKELTMGLGPPAAFSSERYSDEMVEVKELPSPAPCSEHKHKLSRQSTFTDVTSHIEQDKDEVQTSPPKQVEQPKTSKPSPPSSSLTEPAPPPPVFSKPVFAPPPRAAQSSQQHSSNLSYVNAAMSVGLSPRLEPAQPTKKVAPAVSAHSTLESIGADPIFTDDNEVLPTWMAGTQDTEYTTNYDTVKSQSQHLFESQSQVDTGMDMDDDSMMMDEEIDINTIWTFGQAKDDTWSSQPTESHRGDTRTSSRKMLDIVNDGQFQNLDAEVQEVQERSARQGSKEEIVIDETAAFTKGDKEEDGLLQQPSGSQMSMASSTSSQPPIGFFGQAQKLVSSMLGANKKSKPEVKSLQLAAAAAKKQQEEMGKKVTRMKEMEQRRQVALQRKAEEEKTRALEEEKKLKEENERRKREREEHTDKRPLFKPAPKKEDDNNKKRKIAVEEKKTEVKKVPSKTLLTAPSTSKSATTLKSALKPANPNPGPSTQSGSSTNITHTVKIVKQVPPSAMKGKSKLATSKVPSSDDDNAHMKPSKQEPAARPLAPPPLPLPPTESIELPDINSEYSDSDDEDRKRTFDPPEWAQSPELAQALQMQSRINPDDIFGSIRPLRMEEIFRSRASRFRARTSSANWTGADRLTAEEEREYVRRMGYR